MAATEHHAGILPNVNDLMAMTILSVLYIVRLASLGDTYSVPWWTTVVTDAILPTLAGLWLWAAAMYVVYKRVQ